MIMDLKRGMIEWLLTSRTIVLKRLIQISILIAITVKFSSMMLPLCTNNGNPTNLPIGLILIKIMTNMIATKLIIHSFSKISIKGMSFSRKIRINLLEKISRHSILEEDRRTYQMKTLSMIRR